jgi:ABC-type tungstate transport system substrate-binding protein
MKNICTILLPALFGPCLSASIGLLVLFVFPSSLASVAYFWPGTHIAPVLGKTTPTAVMYWLVPEGGAPSYLLLVATGALFSWAVLFTAAAFVIGCRVQLNHSFKPKLLRGSA